MGVITALRSLLRPTVAPPPPPGLTLVRFKRKYVSPTGTYTIGEVAGFPAATALDLIEAGMARKITTPPPSQPAPPPPSLVPVKLTATRHTREGRSYSRGEVIGEDAATAVAPDAELPPAPMPPRTPVRHELPAEITDQIAAERVWMPGYDSRITWP